MVQRTHKQELIALIEQLEDEEFIQMLLEGVEQYANGEGAKVTFHPAQLAALEEANRMIEQGQGVPHQEVMDKARKWLSK